MNTLTFFSKEIREIIKTHKIYVMPAILLFFGFLSPLTAKFTPQLIEEMNKSYGIVPANPIPEAVFTDAYGQLFKNIIQMFFIIILVFAGTVVGEKVKGTAVLILTKPVSRAKFIMSKFFAAISLFTFAFILSVTACIYYTYLLFQKFYTDNLILSLFMLWLFGAFLIAVTIFVSTIGKTFTIAAVLGIVGFIAALGSAAIPYVKKFTPGNLGNLGLEILSGNSPTAYAIAPIIIAVVLTLILIFISIITLKRQEI